MKCTTTITTYAVALLFVGLATIPQVTYAQASADRAVLLQTIQTLLAQIEVLEQMLADRVKGTDSSRNLLDDFEATITHNYTIADQLVLPSSAPDQHEDYVDQLRVILPPRYRSHIDQFIVFRDHPRDLAAFVAVESDGRQTQWVYGVSAEEIKESPTSALSAELMVHEFAHIFTLDQVISSQAPLGSCHEYFDDSSCFPQGSYLAAFISEFWDDALLDELVMAAENQRPDRALKRLYNRWDSEFVTEYAATSPAEDFAESFAWYVLGLDATKGTIAAEKIDFMSRYSDIRSYKSHITSQI